MEHHLPCLRISLHLLDSISVFPTDGSSNRNPPERCPHPLYSRDSTQEDQEIPQEDQEENIMDDKTEVKKEEEPYMRGDQCKEEDIPLEISTGHNRNTWGKCPIKAFEGEKENGDIPAEASEEKQPVTQNLHPSHLAADPSSDPSTHGTNFPQHSPPLTFHTDHREDEAFSCSEWGRCFTQREDLTSHQKSHKRDKPYSCSECGERFTKREDLTSHKRGHKRDKPYSCSDCGKSFCMKKKLDRHQKTHLAPKPYSCFKCGKSFSERWELVKHQRTHLEKKPFSCLLCGQSFFQREYLLSHQITHMGEKPFSCSECGKHYVD
ncbi:hypothetical protein AB205_0084000, partial [Aquarana catesbeiana]